jgi:ATP-dependent protease Clp ATPase subunit
MYDLKALEQVDQIVVNQETVEKRSEPLKIYASKSMGKKVGG